jgi:hypothetical protein
MYLCYYSFSLMLTYLYSVLVSSYYHLPMMSIVFGTRLVWFLCKQVCETCPSTSNRLIFLSIPSQDATCSCFCVNKFAKPAHPHPTASLFCLYRHNTRLDRFLCEQVCETCPSTSNSLTFLSKLSHSFNGAVLSLSICCSSEESAIPGGKPLISTQHVSALRILFWCCLKHVMPVTRPCSLH